MDSGRCGKPDAQDSSNKRLSLRRGHWLGWWLRRFVSVTRLIAECVYLVRGVIESPDLGGCHGSGWVHAASNRGLSDLKDVVQAARVDLAAAEDSQAALRLRIVQGGCHGLFCDGRLVRCRDDSPLTVSVATRPRAAATSTYRSD
jgi:hypothetical protein